MRLPFDPKGAVTHFQAQGERTILGIEDVISYLNNFLVAFQTFESHCKSVRKVIEALTEAVVGARSLVVNSTMSNSRGASSNPSFSIL